MAAPRNITELRDELLQSFDNVKRDPKRLAQAGELANTAGKVIATVKAQLEYAMLKGEEPDIPFLGNTSGRPLRVARRQLSS